MQIPMLSVTTSSKIRLPQSLPLSSIFLILVTLHLHIRTPSVIALVPSQKNHKTRRFSAATLFVLSLILKRNEQHKPESEEIHGFFQA